MQEGKYVNELSFPIFVVVALSQFYILATIYSCSSNPAQLEVIVYNQYYDDDDDDGMHKQSIAHVTRTAHVYLTFSTV